MPFLLAHDEETASTHLDSGMWRALEERAHRDGELLTARELH